MSPETASTEIWKEMRAVGSDETLFEMSENQPVMVVFLRSFGCAFCREAIDDIAQIRTKLSQKGIRILMVHMAPQRETAEKFFKKFKLHPVDHVSDPEANFYRAFGLMKGTPRQLFGFTSWIRGFQSSVLAGRGSELPNPEIGDAFQMPGIFVVHKGEVKNSYIHRYAYDRPDYESICTF